MGQSLLPPDRLRRVAQRFRLLGEPSRLLLLNALQLHGEMNVQDLCTATGQSQANVSKHLRLLLDEQLVARRQDGLYAYYRIDDPMLNAICVLVCGSLDTLLDDAEQDAAEAVATKAGEADRTA